MELRLVTVSLLLLGTTALAQTPPAPTPIQPAVPGQPLAPNATQAPAQDPDKKQQSPEQILKDLAAEKERLAREIAYVQEHAKNQKAMLAQKLAPKPQHWKAIDAGVSAPAFQPMTPMTPRFARLATTEEMANRSNDTLLLVNGRAVTQGMFDELQQFLAGNPAAGDESRRQQVAMFELIKIEGIAAAFEENETAERVGDLQNQLAAGKSIQELAKSVGVVRGASPEGKLEITRNSMFGPRLEQVAFATAAGQRARPFRHTEGVVILQVDKIEKGASPEQDKVHAAAILVPYSPDAAAVTKAQTAVNTGQIDLLVRDERTMAMLPAMFKKPATPPMPVLTPDQGQRLQQELDQIGRDMAELQKQDNPEAQQKLKLLNQRQAELMAQLRAADGVSTDGDTTKATVDVGMVKKQLESIAAQLAALQGKTDAASLQQIEGLKKAYETLKAQLGAAAAPAAPTEIKVDAKPPVKNEAVPQKKN